MAKILKRKDLLTDDALTAPLLLYDALKDLNKSMKKHRKKHTKFYEVCIKTTKTKTNMKVFTDFLLWLSCTLTIVSLILIIALAAQHRNDSLTYLNQFQWFWRPGVLFLMGVLTFFWFAMRQDSDR